MQSLVSGGLTVTSREQLNFFLRDSRGWDDTHCPLIISCVAYFVHLADTKQAKLRKLSNGTGLLDNRTLQGVHLSVGVFRIGAIPPMPRFSAELVVASILANPA